VAKIYCFDKDRSGTDDMYRTIEAGLQQRLAQTPIGAPTMKEIIGIPLSHSNPINLSAVTYYSQKIY
jgi:hypothetical protein